MCLVMQGSLFFLRRLLVPGVADRWRQLHPRNGRASLVIFCQRPGSFIAVAVNRKTFLGGEVKKREHVTTRQGRDKRFFRVYVSGLGIGGWYDLRRGRGGDRRAPIEVPSVNTAKAFVYKDSAVAIPSDYRCVIGHSNLHAWAKGSGNDAT